MSSLFMISVILTSLLFAVFVVVLTWRERRRQAQPPKAACGQSHCNCTPAPQTIGDAPRHADPVPCTKESPRAPTRSGSE